MTGILWRSQFMSKTMLSNMWPCLCTCMLFVCLVPLLLTDACLVVYLIHVEAPLPKNLVDFVSLLCPRMCPLAPDVTILCIKCHLAFTLLNISRTARYQGQNGDLCSFNFGCKCAGVSSLHLLGLGWKQAFVLSEWKHSSSINQHARTPPKHPIAKQKT